MCTLTKVIIHNKFFSLVIVYSSLRMRIYVPRACTFQLKHFHGFLFALSRNNATEIAVRHDTSFIYRPNLISVSDPPAMTAFEGSLPFRASSSVPLTGTALFIVTSHLCMNPRDSIVTYT